MISTYLLISNCRVNRVVPTLKKCKKCPMKGTTRKKTGNSLVQVKVGLSVQMVKEKDELCCVI